MVRKIFFAVLTLITFSPAAARAQGGGAPDVDTHRAEVGVLYTGVNLVVPAGAVLLFDVELLAVEEGAGRAAPPKGAC